MTNSNVKKDNSVVVYVVFVLATVACACRTDGRD